MMDTMTRERSLAELVKQVHESLSYRDMAARARRAGHAISHAQLAAYAAGEVTRAPSDAQVRALAAALDMGYEQVRGAMFVQYYGYVPRELNTGRPHLRSVAAIPPDLPPEDDETLARMVELWLESHHRK